MSDLKPTTVIALDWAIRSFGKDHVYDMPVRVLRLVEEVVELAQAHDIPYSQLHRLIDIVYDRPRGDPEQEIGGVMMVATLFCAVCGVEADEVFHRELRRVLEKSPEHFAKRNQEKIDLGLGIEPEEEIRW
jgi:NTP pyrophosphatase (non-canonical NTP hydrolase)